MNVFIFQSKPDRYDLREKLQPGDTVPWHATRYQKKMHPGDFVFFWLAGRKDHRGLYGWGQIVSEPYRKQEWNGDAVNVRYQSRFAKPILATSLASEKALQNLMILRAPQATNFLLSPEEAEHFRKMVDPRHVQIRP
jgi:hypothetical protein